VDTGSREENASKQESRPSVLILSEPKVWLDRPAHYLVLTRFLEREPVPTSLENALPPRIKPGAFFREQPGTPENPGSARRCPPARQPVAAQNAALSFFDTGSREN